jgi:peptidoglycan hydrolase CwlO-like protein
MNTFLRSILFISLIFLFFVIRPLQAEDSCDSICELTKQIEDLQGKITETQGKQKTLASTITYLDSKIRLTTAEINKTQTEIKILSLEIENLGDKIGSLNTSLDSLTRLLVTRIEETYKSMYFKPAYVFLNSDFSSNVLTKFEYLKTVQNNDKTVVYQLEAQRQDFNKQQNLKKQKQKELKVLEQKLSDQKKSLDQQKRGKESLLAQTKNDEVSFQSMLKKAMAELEAIQSIIAGLGDESEVGSINEGDRIATIISGPSACSTGTHLHFEVARSGAHDNPANYLKNISVGWDLCGWYGCDGPFGFSGSWNWPLSGDITITQGYGMTAFARSGYYGGNPHTGLDMQSSDMAVRAVQKGKLFRGSIPCGSGTLRYVRVQHEDGGTDTYYLHVNYY